MSNDMNMSELFPWRASVTGDEAVTLAPILILNEQPVGDSGIAPPAGSSFAVTPDYDRDRRIFWLSDVSLRRVKYSGRFPSIEWEATTRAWI